MPSSITSITLKAKDFASKPIKGVASSIGNLGRSISRLRYAALGVAAALGGFGIANEFIEANRQVENMTARLGSLLNNAKAGNEAFDWIRNFQKQNPVRSIQEFGDSFEQLVAAGINPTTGALKSLTAGAVKFGLSAGDVAGVTRALKQMLAVSNLQKQELNQLSERIPGIQSKMAKALGMTTDQFIKQTTLMKVSSKDAAKAVLNILGENADEVIARFTNTWDAGMNRLKSSWFDLLTEIGKTGIFDDLKSGMDVLVKTVKNNMTEISQFAKATWNFVKETIKGFFNVDFGSDTLMDTFTTLADFYAGVITNFMNGFRVLEVAISNIAKLAYKVLSEINRAGARFEMMKLNIFSEEGLNDEIKKVEDVLYRVSQTVANSKSVSDDPLEVRFPEQMKLIDEYGGKLDKLLQIRRDFTSVDTPFKMTFAEDIDEMVQSISKMEAAQRTFRDDMKNLRLATRANTSLDKLFGEGGDEPVMAMSDNFTSALENIDSLNEEKADKVANDWDKSVQKIKKSYDDAFGSIGKTIGTFTEGIDRSLNKTFDDFFDKLINGHMPNLKNAINSFLQDILQMMVRMQTQKLAMNIATSFANFASGYVTSGGAADGGVMQTSSPSTSVGMQGPLQSNSMFKASQPTRVEIVNNSGIPMEATSARVKGDQSGQVMQVVMDSLARNKGGSRDALKSMMAT